MDRFFLTVISLVAVVSMVAIVGIVFENDNIGGTDRNLVGYDVYLHNSPPWNNVAGKSIESSVEYDYVPNRVGYDIYMHLPRGSNTPYPHESEE